MDKIEDIFRKINLESRLQAQVPMADRTTFKTGGSAQWLATPRTSEEARLIWKAFKIEALPLTVLGRGANILVSDRGIPGLVLDLTGLNAFELRDNLLWAQAGADPSRLSEETQPLGLSCLEFLYAMPSSLGGAVYMNARCYDREISEVVDRVLIVNETGEWETITRDQSSWAYKDSPFMHRDVLILEAWFRTSPRPPEEIKTQMKAHQEDRREKGHFMAPCAGSYFKNNRAFGAPTGVLIDRLGLKGLQEGGAQVAPWHGNILINTQGATASDIRRLGDRVKMRVQEATGFQLEEEVVFLGNWGSWPES